MAALYEELKKKKSENPEDDVADPDFFGGLLFICGKRRYNGNRESIFCKMEGRIMSLEKAKKYLESKGCLDWKECATPRAGWMCAKSFKLHLLLIFSML